MAVLLLLAQPRTALLTGLQTAPSPETLMPLLRRRQLARHPPRHLRQEAIKSEESLLAGVTCRLAEDLDRLPLRLALLAL